LLGLIGALVLAGAVFFITYSTQKAVEDSAAKERLDMGFNADPNAKTTEIPVFVKLTSPLLKGGTLSLAIGFYKPDQLEKYKKNLRAAGLHRVITAEQFAASKFWFALVLGIGLLLHHLFATEPSPVWVPLFIPVIAFFLPDLDLNNRKTLRQREVLLGMPYVMDLMTLSMEAGLEFQGAISRVIEKAPPSPFIEELSEVLKEIQLGRSRAEGLRKMAQSVDLSEITSLVAVLISADQMGSPVGPVLRAQSETLRADRLVKAEKLGAQATQKMLLPLVGFIFPSVLLIIAAPYILQFIGAR
jgi:tight adherence protein C